MTAHLIDGFLFFLNLNLFLFYADPVLMEPETDLETIQYAVEGQDVHVICHESGVEEQLADLIDEKLHQAEFCVEWIIPKTADNSTSRFTTENIANINISANQLLENSLKNLTSKLKIQNITKLDEGDYRCLYKSCLGFNLLPVTKFIEVFSTDEIVRVDSENIVVNAKLENLARWILRTFIHPQTANFTLTWLGPKETDLTELHRSNSSGKYVVKEFLEKYPYEIILKIKNVNVTDTGNYIVIAENGENQKNLSLELFVWRDPEIQEVKYDEFYHIDAPKNVSCVMFGNPLPNLKIQWKFQKCDQPDDPTFCGSDGFEPITYNETKQLSEYLIKSSIEFDTKYSGRLMCYASDELCDIVKKVIPIRVTKVLGLLFKSQNEVTVGDDVVLTCVANTRNCGYVQWIERKDLKLRPFFPPNPNVTNYLDEFSFHIRNVNKTDSGSYECLALQWFKAYEVCKEELKLIVLDVKPPKIIETNLNNSEIVVTSVPFSLNCSATGVPSPTISWYKDKELILSNQSDYDLLNNNQTLTIKSLTEGEERKYCCIATNKGEPDDKKCITFRNFYRYERNIMFILLGVVSFIFITCISILIYCIYRKKKMDTAARINFIRGKPESINPDLPLDDQTDLLPYDPKWEFPRKKLVYGKQLGAGAFGVVMKAEAFGILKKNQWTTVAVKMVKRHSEPIYLQALASELKIMVHLGKHLNVVNLLGACTKNLYKQKLLVIVEFCTFGNLHQYLLSHRDDFINQINPDTGEIDVDYSDNQDLLRDAYSSDETLNSTELSDPHIQNFNKENTDIPESSVILEEDYRNGRIKKLTTSTLVCWAFQIARGMEHLARKRVVHGDLAARNILLTDHNVVKICDFGLAKKMYNNPNYKKSTNYPLPVHWMAIECVMDGIYSTDSDVWSYGIVLWELFSLARKPYPEFDDFSQIQEKLIEGYRMPCPLYANQFLHDMMLECWSQHPSRRPSFMELSESLGKLLEKNVREHYIELDSVFQRSSLLALEGDGYLNKVENTTVRERYVDTPTRNKRSPDKISLKNSESLEMRRRSSSAEAPKRSNNEEIERKPIPTESVLGDDGYLISKTTAISESSPCV